MLMRILGLCGYTTTTGAGHVPLMASMHTMTTDYAALGEVRIPLWRTSIMHIRAVWSKRGNRQTADSVLGLFGSQQTNRQYCD